jgi:hypothetical protein
MLRRKNYRKIDTLFLVNSQALIERIFSLSISHGAWTPIHSITVCFPLHMHEYSHKCLATGDALLSRNAAEIRDMVRHCHQLSCNNVECFLQPSREIHKNKILFSLMNLHHAGKRQYLSENDLSLTNGMNHAS